MAWVRTSCVSAVAALALLAGCSKAPTPGGAQAAESEAVRLARQEAAVPVHPLKEAYFGETHAHTSYSLDAYIGGARLTPNDAYRFAQGEDVTINGVKHNIGRPLDFAAVTDHAEYLGEMYSTQVPGAPGHDQPLLQELRGLTKMDEMEAWFIKYVVSSNRSGTPAHPAFFAGPDSVKGGWRVELEATQRNYRPGVFTTIPAFEWSGAPGGGNLHRNIFFRDMNVPSAPVSYIDTHREDGLWAWLAGLEAHGARVFAVPHNSNASKTLMFGGLDAAGKPYDAAYAKIRNHFEPLIEMMQIKGNSEVHRDFWEADEFANFENADSIANYSDRKRDPRNYVRWGVIQGLAYKPKLGVNPFQYGFVGGTDNHNGAPGDVSENDFIGSHGAADGTVVRRREADVAGWLLGKDLNPGAVTGVWAVRNTRGDIWDAMRSRETFATSGPRIKVRFFAGSALAPHPADALALVKEGYSRGVPMGGTLSRPGKAPVFSVYAEKDPAGANLDRIQIIKGWVDGSGGHHEKIIDVVWSGGRRIGADGKLPPVGDTVDLKTAAYTNAIGAPVLMGSWTDHDFDPKANALYYARVLEIPTPRWSTFDAVRNHLPLLADVPATIQERAWSSPIWSMPQ